LVPRASGTRFISEQGTKMGRRSILHVKILGDRGVDGINVGGHVTPIAEATMTLATLTLACHSGLTPIAR
jgi:predicted PhzF superfamily epimerase YddE/YHI9